LTQETPELVSNDLIVRQQKILKAAESKGGNAHEGIVMEEAWMYDENFVGRRVDMVKLEVMADEKKGKKCGLCGGVGSEESAGKLCPVCESCEIGKVALGKKIMD